MFTFVEDGTFAIDRALARFGDHEDKSAAGGHFYSNKAPGLILAAVPVYRALRAAALPPRTGTAAIFDGVRIATVTLVALAGLLLFARRLCGSPAGDAAPLLVLAVGCGTPFLFYGRSFFSHAWTASLLYDSWECLRVAGPRRAAARGVLVVAAGALAGAAVLSEYAAAPIALILAARAVARDGAAPAAVTPGRAARLALFAAGAVPFAALLLAYQKICFGSPWAVSYAEGAYPGYANLTRSGLLGLSPPRPAIAAAFVVHPGRGVLLFSPFLAWALRGWRRWWRSGEDRADWWTSAAAVALLVLTLSGYPHWQGGFSLGSRLLLPALFFAAWPIAYALDTPPARGLFAAAAVFSVAHFFLLTAAYPHLPPAIGFPAANFSVWALRRGWAAPNLLSARGSVLSLLPPLAVAAAATWACLGALPAPRPGKPVAAALGAVLFAALLALAPPLEEPERRWREEVRALLQPPNPPERPHIIVRSP